jgi:2-polyprenyl-6-hydroxyphenyl methylase/3-demethylubiquinone-9 3-methyltransferase
LGIIVTQPVDVGCGEGIITAVLSEKTRTIIGCDYSIEALEIARKQHPDIEFVYSNSTSLAFSDRSFTKVVMADVAEHLMPVQLIKTLHR